MHCGVMVTGYNQGDWGRLLKGDYDRPPAVSDAENMDNTLYLGELIEPLGFDSIWATEHYGLGADISWGRAGIAAKMRYAFGNPIKGSKRRPMPDAMPYRQHTLRRSISATVAQRR